MPNWCMNNLTITGNPEKLAAIKAAADKGEMLQHMVPMPKELLDTTSPSDGPNWYSWRLEHWGTKWDNGEAYGDIDGDTLSLSFDTAWGPPTAAYENYTNENTDIHIEAGYYEPGMAFVGNYDSGLGTDISWDIDFSEEDWRDDLPQDVIDDWDLDNEYEQWKEWQEEEEDD
jgi:hypothetical protein